MDLLSSEFYQLNKRVSVACDERSRGGGGGDHLVGLLMYEFQNLIELTILSLTDDDGDALKQ